MSVEIKLIAFEQVVPLWHKAWATNPSNVKPVNTCTFQFVRGYDANIPYSPVYFYGLYLNNLLVGCNSIYLASRSHWCRTRGLYVEEDYRGNGYGSTLIQYGIQLATRLHATYLWGYPRCTSWPLWEKHGFVSRGRVSEVTLEYGPHVWAYLTL